MPLLSIKKRGGGNTLSRCFPSTIPPKTAYVRHTRNKKRVRFAEPDLALGNKKQALKKDSPDWISWLGRIKEICRSSVLSGDRNSKEQLTQVGEFFALEFDKISGDNRPFLKVDVFGGSIMGLVDSGSSNTIISRQIFESFRQPHSSLVNKHSQISIRTANGSTSKTEGVFKLPIHFLGRVRLLSVFVLKELSVDLILGVDFLSSFGITTNFENFSFTVPRNECFAIEPCEVSPDDLARLESLKSSYFSQAAPLGRTHLVQHHINTGEAVPIKQRYYPVSKPIQNFIQEEVDRMLQLDVIQPSKSPWSSPIVVAKKSNGEYRLCLDFRKLNAVTKKDAYPLPYMNVILDKLGGAKFFTSLDLRSAFWQIPLTEESREKTAFVVPGRGLFEFKVMPFGLSNAPPTMQRLVDSLLGPEFDSQVFFYLDDAILISSNFESHLRLISQVFEKLKEAGLSLNEEKCKFAKPQLKYLGYVVDQGGLRVDPEKVEAVKDYPVPRGPKDIRRFLGLASWYRRFIKDFAEIAAPLSRLNRKNAKWCWSSEAEASFQSLKSSLTTTPVLSCPNFELPFQLQCDASNFAVGCILTQAVPEGEKVIAYASRSLSKSERNYSVTEKECLSVLFGVEKFRCYLEGTRFVVVTDHSSLQWLNSLKNPQGRLARWALKIQEYDYNIIHRKGKLHVAPDALSRIECSLITVSPDDLDTW